MNPIFTSVIINRILEQKKKKSGEKKTFTSYELAKEFRNLKIIAYRLLKDFFLISAGVFAAAFGLKSFLLANNFIDGGATGISLLVSIKTLLPLYLIIICINIPFIIMGYKTIGKGFAIKTIFAISGLSIVLATVHFPFIGLDNFLVSVFGGFFLGAGIGFSIRGGAVIDGTEVLAIYLSKKLGVTIGDVILGINIIIFSVAAYLLSIEIALYSIVTYLSASKTVDFITEGIEEYVGVTIVSPKSEEIRQMILNKMGRGVTIYSGKRGYGKNGETGSVEIVYSVLTRLELNKLNTEILKIDPNAFVVMNSVKDVKGGMIKKRPMKQ